MDLFDETAKKDREIMKLRAENDALWQRIFELVYDVTVAQREMQEAILNANCAQKMNSYYRDKIKKIEEERRIERAAAYAEIKCILKK